MRTTNKPLGLFPFNKTRLLCKDRERWKQEQRAPLTSTPISRPFPMSSNPCESAMPVGTYSDTLQHSGFRAGLFKTGCVLVEKNWSHPPDSNRRPTDYESVALPTELGWLTTRRKTEFRCERGQKEFAGYIIKQIRKSTSRRVSRNSVTSRCLLWALPSCHSRLASPSQASPRWY